MKKKAIFSLLLIVTILMTGCSAAKNNDNNITSQSTAVSDEKSTSKEDVNKNEADKDKNSNNETDKNEGNKDKTSKDETNIDETNKDVSSENSINDTGKDSVSTELVKVNIEDMFSDRDYKTEYDENKSAFIQLEGDNATCTSNAVQISGSTITITDEGTYIVSGKLDDGMIIINADKEDKLQLVLNDVTINSESSAPIYILNADKVFITLAENSENSLSNGGAFTSIDENNIDAVIFSKDDLTLNGSGSLTIDSPAGHGIVSKDDLVLTSGTYTVNSASHGLVANDCIKVADADITVNAGKDGIHAENSEDTSLGYIYIASGNFTIASEGDGISAGAYIQLDDGNYNIVTGGGSVNGTKQTSDSWGDFRGGPGGGGRGPNPFGSTSQAPDEAEEDNGTSIKAVKASGSIIIGNGTFVIDSADDAIHSNSIVSVENGSFEIATGDDAFHADETLDIIAGVINITKSYEGLEALNVKLSGGDINLVASDDGINAAGGNDQSGMGGPRGNDMFGGGSSNGSIVISGGNIYMNASGDGIDANGTLEITGGMITVCGPVNGDTAVLDYDSGANISGGTFIGTGAMQMAQTFSSAEQGLISIRLQNQSEGTLIELKDTNGNVIISYEPKLPFGLVILSTPEMVSGETYTLSIGSLSEEVTAN